MVNDGLAHKQLHTLVGTRQHSLISGEGERSCRTVVHFVLLRCHYLTARIKEVTRLWGGGSGEGRPEVFAPPVSFIDSLRDWLHPLNTQMHTCAHTHIHTNSSTCTVLRNCISTHIPPHTHTRAHTDTHKNSSLIWTLTCYTNVRRGELTTRRNVGKQWLVCNTHTHNPTLCVQPCWCPEKNIAGVSMKVCDWIKFNVEVQQ